MSYRGDATPRPRSILAARRFLGEHRARICVLDTETTGLHEFAEICEISIIDADGVVLLDTLVKPVNPIPEHVSVLHGITNEMVMDAPTMAEVQPELFRVLECYQLPMIYNSLFDVRMIEQSLAAVGLDQFKSVTDWMAEASKCVMTMYSDFAGVWDGRCGTLRKHKLSKAALACGVSAVGAHRALADVHMTLGVLKFIAAADLPQTRGIAFPLRPEF